LRKIPSGVGRNEPDEERRNLIVMRKNKLPVKMDQGPSGSLGWFLKFMGGSKGGHNGLVKKEEELLGRGGES